MNCVGDTYISEAPDDKDVKEGDKVTLTCKAKGAPSNITYKWFKDNVAFNPRVRGL